MTEMRTMVSKTNGYVASVPSLCRLLGLCTDAEPVAAESAGRRLARGAGMSYSRLSRILARTLSARG